jgi:NTP pyrophosphatase (non-canonical NTP hydrolase)
MQSKTLTLYKLNGIKPTLESTMIKLAEETGELARLIGKGQQLSAESPSVIDTPPSELITEMGRELLDVAQTCITHLFILEEEYGLNTETLLAEHHQKLIKKGYINET